MKAIGKGMVVNRRGGKRHVMMKTIFGHSDKYKKQVVALVLNLEWKILN